MNDIFTRGRSIITLLENHQYLDTHSPMFPLVQFPQSPSPPKFKTLPQYPQPPPLSQLSPILSKTGNFVIL